MKTQTIINCVFAIAFIALAVGVVTPRDAAFNKITCMEWNVVDKDKKVRISAGTYADGNTMLILRDKEQKQKLSAATDSVGNSSVMFFDKDGKIRITAHTDTNGYAGLNWFDKDENLRIRATTKPDGTVALPTNDLEPPKKP